MTDSETNMTDTSIPPYSEAKIVKLVTEVFKMLIDLQHFPSSLVVFPPADSEAGHQFSPKISDLFESLKLSAAVVSLLRHLPHICESSADVIEIFLPESVAICYGSEQSLRMSRDPRGTYEEIRYDYFLPTEVALTQQGGLYGHMLILNVDNNTIRDYGWSSLPGIPSASSSPREQALRSKYPYPDDSDDYRNLPALSAPAFLQHWVDDIRNLMYIPFRGLGGDNRLLEPPHRDAPPRPPPSPPPPSPPYPDAATSEAHNRYEMVEQEYRDASAYADLKRVLQENYGWPDNFRKEDYARDHERIWYEVQHRYQPPRDDQ